MARTTIGQVWVCGLAAMAVVMGCDGSPTDTAPGGATVRAQPAEGGAMAVARTAGVSPSSGSMEVGGTLQLTALGVYGNTVNGAAWTSSNPAVATVSQGGLVTGVASGTATITATSSGGSGAAQVTVGTGNPVADAPAPAPTEPAPPSTGGPAFQDGFEGGVLAAAQNGISWSATYNMKVSSTVRRSGSYALRGIYPATAPKNPPLVQQSLDLPKVRELWVEYYVYVPTNWGMTEVDGSDNKKWFLVKDAELAGGNNAVAVVFEYDTTPTTAPNARLLVKYEVDEGQSQYAYKTRAINGFLTTAHRGKWVQFRAHVKLAGTRSGSGNTATGDGAIRVWRDGVLLYSDLKAPLKAVSSTLSARNYLGHGYLLGAANNGFSQQTIYDVDDVKIYRSSPGW